MTFSAAPVRLVPSASSDAATTATGTPPQGAPAGAVVAPGVDQVLAQVAQVLSDRVVDTGDDVTQCALDAAFDRLLARVEAARAQP